MSKANNLTDFLTDVADAIREKKGKAEKINPQDFSSEILSIESGEGEVVESKEYKDVNFFDYEGTILYSYTWEEAQALTEMPPLPDRTSEGLVCQGWNWTYEELQQAGGFADVGAIYTTDDGKNHFYVRIDESVGCDISIYLGESKHSVVIEWGDGEEETFNDVTGMRYRHKYANYGYYTIKVAIIDGVAKAGTPSYPMFQTNKQEYNNARKLLRAHVVNLGLYNNSFNFCRNLERITTTAYCGTYYYAFVTSTNVQHFNFPLSPSEIKQVGTFKTASICSGGRVNSSIWNLGRIASIPLRCSIENISFDAHTLLEDIRGVDGKLKISSQYLFRGCNCIKVRYSWWDMSITSIGTGCFTNCWSLVRFKCPPLITTINATVFQNCYSLKLCDFTELADVPSLVNSNAFTGIPADCKIVVPDELEDAWKAATNWTTYADYIIGKTEYINGGGTL